MRRASSLSPLRARLCSRENAIRVAQRMMQSGIAVMVAPGDDMQPWRVIERADLSASERVGRIHVAEALSYRRQPPRA